VKVTWAFLKERVSNMAEKDKDVKVKKGKAKDATGRQAELEQAEKVNKETLRLAKDAERLEAIEDEAHGEYKAAKEEREAAEKKLRTYILQINKPLPLLDGKDKAAETKTAANAPAPGNDAWRTVPLSEVLIKAQPCLKLLASAKIGTMGDLQAFTAKKNDFANPLQAIAGIGELKADAIETDVLAWWAAHPQYTEKGVDKPGAKKPTEEPKKDEPAAPPAEKKDLKGGLDVK
jgi:hypothetical protein